MSVRCRWFGWHAWGTTERYFVNKWSAFGRAKRSCGRCGLTQDRAFFEPWS